MSAKKMKNVIGMIYLTPKTKTIRFLWHLPDEDKELGEKLGEVIMQTIYAYYKAKGIKGGVVESPKTKKYVA